jgi:hypothetical protein
VEHDRGRVGAKTMLLNARPMHYENEARRMILLAIEDITTRRQAERWTADPGVRSGPAKSRALNVSMDTIVSAVWIGLPHPAAHSRHGGVTEMYVVS